MPTMAQARRLAISQGAEQLYLRRETHEVSLMISVLELMLQEVQDDFIRAPVADLSRIQATAGQLAQLIKMLTHPRVTTQTQGDTNAR